MTTIIKYLYGVCALLLLSLSACCWTDDSRVPPGYPFNGNSHELNFSVYGRYDWSNNPRGHYIDSLELVRDTATFIKAFGRSPDIDFSKYDLAIPSAFVDQVFEVKFQKRALIDHHAKTYIIELRAYTKTCNSGLNANYNNYYISEFLLIPKIPLGYTFEMRHFFPVQHF